MGCAGTRSGTSARWLSWSIGLSAIARRIPTKHFCRPSPERRAERVAAASRRPTVATRLPARMDVPRSTSEIRSRRTGMTKAARRTIMILLALGLAVSMTGWVAAQQPAPPAQQPAPAQPGTSTPQDTDDDLTSDLALTRASIQLRRQAIITSVMDLSPAESQTFWPLYREDRIRMAKAGDPLQPLP